nr:amidohydrolase family protein [Sphingobacterium sp. UBA3519]
MAIITKYLFFLLPFFILSCKSSQQKGDTFYFGGNIITMEDDFPQVDALVVKGGKILFVGSRKEAAPYVGENTKQIDLKGKTLLPGFIDAHGHITSRAGMEQAIDLSPSPYGTVNSIPDLQKTILSVIKRTKLGASVPVLGNGYDDAIMREHRHPTRQELDAISTTNPIIVIHASGHASVANSAMLKLLGIAENVKDPEGDITAEAPIID